MNLTFFSNPEKLKLIGQRRIDRLFLEFAEDLRLANISLPPPEPETDDYFPTVAALITSPGFPERVRLGLAMLELLADPQNLDRLDAEVQRHLPCASFDRTLPAVDRAMELFIWNNAATARLADEILAARKECSSQSSPEPPAASPEHPAASPEHPASSPVPPSTLHPQLSTCSKRLSHPNIITRIGTLYLDSFFRIFAQDLAARNITVPERIPDACDRAAAYAKIFSTPEILPPAMLEALQAIEEFASPKNRQLLEKLTGDLDIDDSREPEGWALRLWVRAPFDLQYIKTLQAHIPENYYDGEIEYCDPDEAECARASSTASVQQGNPLQPPAVANEATIAAVEINRCPRNKIARLPKETRDSINRMFGQGLTYAEVLTQLGDRAVGLNKSSLSRWKRGPYQQWLKHQERLEESGTQVKFALEAVRQNQNNQIHEATQQIAALRISELFTQLDLSTLKEAVTNDPATLVRLAHLLPKLSEGGLQCERQRFELAQSKPAAPAEKVKGPIKRGISRKALRYIEREIGLM